MYKVLIVEDNYLQIQSLMQYVDWGKFGITEIRTAQDGMEGLEIFRNYNPDIIITDVVMPVMDGITMVKEIKKISDRPQIIYVSCFEDFHYVQEAIRNEAISYILKPICKEELEKSLEKIIGHVEYEKKYSTMNTLIQENVDMHRKNFLCRLIYTRRTDEDFLKSAAKVLGLNEFDSFVAVKTEIVNIENTETDIFGFLDTTEQYLLKNENAFAVSENDNRIVIIFMGKNYNGDDFLAYVKGRMEYFASKMKTGGLMLKTGMSKAYTEFEGVKMLAQAGLALEDTVSMDDEDISVGDDGFAGDIIDYIPDMKEMLGNILDSHDGKAELEKFLDVYCAENVSLSKYHIRMLAVSVLTILQMLLYEREVAVNDMFHNLNIMNNLNMIENINDLRWLIEVTVSSAEELLKTGLENMYEKVIAGIKDYINLNYKSIKNIKEIANESYLSESYARKVFKECTGQTIFEYLVQKRMEEAKKLLSNPENKVYEVAQQVGYNSTQRFIDVFKQYTGILPKSFQNKASGKE